jgi:dTDP-4-dehydrorhamnose 3,5-epimerase
MRFEPTKIEGVVVVHIEARGDERGFFGRIFCPDEFKRAGLDFVPYHMNLSRSVETGTLRGLHFQRAPHREDKLVRCVRGRIWDVALDLRQESSTYGQWAGIELDHTSARAFLVPKGCAHGFITLEPDSDVLYLTSHPYTASHEGAVRWNDPQFAIAWPTTPRVISPRDGAAPDYVPEV